MLRQNNIRAPIAKSFTTFWGNWAGLRTVSRPPHGCDSAPSDHHHFRTLEQHLQNSEVTSRTSMIASFLTFGSKAPSLCAANDCMHRS
ncbi:hypothetical protein KIN20_031903 [Parelaphostrongylus tenuis]|uniref:Uncharacterized protein n=1 Tax=Parelaphostrongylus tenuis TaxID=148309 RepID=A0AAD5R630_PARTN|nr:hypothetical protein KIN20_031903 [Parelaphostrongylus tenuis]